MIFVTHNGDPEYDQELFNNDMDLVFEPNGNNLCQFKLEADAPDLSKLVDPADCFETSGITI